MSSKIENFGMHGSTGLFVAHDKWGDWVLEHQNKPGYTQENGYGLGVVLSHSWEIDGKTITVPNAQWTYSTLLPDRSGFIGFERERKPNNCVLLDAFGKERMRLTVPWKLTGAGSSESATFGDVDGPYADPSTGVLGVFGVSGWVGNAKFYFELDYHTGKFFWCKRIRD